MVDVTYTDIWHNKMRLLYPGGYPNRRTIRFKNLEFWIEKLSPCEIAYLFVSATDPFSSSEFFFQLWSTIEDENPEPRSLVQHSIGIPPLEVFFMFDMEVESDDEEGVNYINVLDDSLFVGMPDDGFDVTEEDFSREIPEISWKDFLMMIDIIAYNEYDYTSKYLGKTYQRNLDKLKTLTPFQSTALCKKIEAMEVDKKIINLGRGKSLGLF
jgi:hypothetical protein